MEGRIEIRTSRVKAVLVLIGCALFVAIGVWLLIDPAMSYMIKIVGIIGILFFGLGLIVFPKKLIRSQIGIVIDKCGVTDYITKPEVGTIEWCDITHVEIIHIAYNKMLAIYVKNPEEYLSRVRVQGLENNYQLVGTPFVIPSSILKIKLKDLELIINTKLKEYHYAG